MEYYGNPYNLKKTKNYEVVPTFVVDLSLRNWSHGKHKASKIK
jgi:hypothetical protein